MSRRDPPAHLVRQAPTPAPALPASAGIPPDGLPAAQSESPHPEPPAASAATGPQEAPELVLAVPTTELARQIQAHAKAWLTLTISNLKAHPQGVVRVRLVVDPNLPDKPDDTWIQTMLILKTGGTLIDGTIQWGDNDGS